MAANPPKSRATGSKGATPGSKAATAARSSPPAGSPRRDDGTGIVNHDPWLEPYSERLRERFNHYKNVLHKIEQASPGGLLGPVSQGHHYFGLNRGTADNTPAGRPGV